jgi:hypothetical protein
MITQPDALDEAIKMMQVPMKDLPSLALEFGRHLSSQYGMCMEVLLTAYACYNQAVLGMPCSNEEYRILPAHAEWFATKKV